MRTNIDIDDESMRAAMEASGETTKRAVVKGGLRLLIDTRAQGGIRRLRGKVKWNGDLSASRANRSPRSLHPRDPPGTMGRTVRKTIDCIIATFCLREGHSLLHADRDFDAFESRLGLQVIRP